MLATLVAAALGLASLPPTTHAAPPAPIVVRDDLPDTAHGRAAAAFIRAVNEGSADSVRAFEESYRSAPQRQAVSLDERVKRFQQMHRELAPLTITRVLDRPHAPLTVVARAANGSTVRLEFLPAEAESDRLDGVVVAVGGEDLEPREISGSERAEAVHAAAAALESGYVFPDVGRRMGAAVLEKLEQGGYAGVNDDLALASALTADLRAVSHDLHLGIHVAPADPEPTEDIDEDAMLREMAAENFGFREAEILPGNIGYLRFDFFVPGPEAEATAAGAMAFLRNCDAIVFDLRGNGGGSPEMIRFLTSYLFDSPTHLNDMVDRDGKVVEEYWTLESVPGERFGPDLPVFVLTSPRTGSGAEEFSYNLKNLKRATIIGEKTWGGAHPIRSERISDRLVINVPFMRACNPITKTNWEGVGVEPDVKVPAPEALDRALGLARDAIAAAPHASR